MDSIFRMGFQVSSFRPLPFRTQRLGQEDLDPLTPMEPDTTTKGLYTSYDQGPPSSGPISGLYTSIDQDKRPVESLPGAVFNLPSGEKLPDKQPAGTSDADWAKALAAAIAAGGAGYGAYTKEEIAKMNKQAAQLKASNPSVAPLLVTKSSGISSTPLIIAGIGALGLIGLVVALK